MRLFCLQRGEKMKVYLDHAATTPVDPRVLTAMQPYFSEKFGNASSIHSWGEEAREAIEKSREKIAKSINADAKEIIFTSGGTEANNFAIKGMAFKKKKGRIITSKTEHDCVLNSCKWLKTQGFDVIFLDVDKYGLVSVEDVEKNINDETILVTIMHANNEIGTIAPIEEIGKICDEKEVPFHSDACQSYTKETIDVKKQNISMLTINAHKIYGPKGVGALYLRNGVKPVPLAHGGGHEFGLRSGTENVPGIVGFAKAVEIAKKEDNEKMRKLRDILIKSVLEEKTAHLNGHPTKRLCNNANFYFENVEGEALILRLNEMGIAVSTGSACSSHSLQPSHVLIACGLLPEEAHASLRASVGKENTKEEIEYSASAIIEQVNILRQLSPQWK